MAKQSVYSISSTQEFISSMIEKGWDCVELDEGVLGVGDLVLIAPDDKHYNFVIREVYLNEWSSGQTIRKCAKLSQKILKEIEKAELEQEESYN